MELTRTNVIFRVFLRFWLMQTRHRKAQKSQLLWLSLSPSHVSSMRKSGTKKSNFWHLAHSLVWSDGSGNSPALSILEMAFSAKGLSME